MLIFGIGFPQYYAYLPNTLIGKDHKFKSEWGFAYSISTD